MKRWLSQLLSLIVVLGVTTSMPLITNAATTPAAVSSDVAYNRIYELYNILGGSYFNTTQNTACGTKSSGHSCSYCRLSSIIKQSWFVNRFGSLAVSQFPITYYSNGSVHGPDGWSCFGFASFAEWYIYKTATTDKVTTTYIGTFSYDYSTVSGTVQTGDLIRVGDSHSAIVISCDSTGVNVLDSNWSGSYNCQVNIHKIKYTSYSKFSISRAQNAAGGSNTPTNQYTSTNPDSYTYPTRTLKQTSPVMSGSDVAWVQAVLKKLGYNITIDGKYGPNTASVVKQFQSAYGLTVDGYCGPKTREKLLALWNAMKHTHNYVWKRTVSATCTQTGKKVYECSCGASYTETIAALGHSFPEQWIVDTVATCTQTGYKHHSCTMCGVTAYAVTPTKQHTTSAWITDKEPTCTQDGSKHKECTVCGKILETGTIISVVGHVVPYYWTVDKPATCTQDGSKSKHCVKCDAKTNVIVIPAKGHTVGDWITDTPATVYATGSEHRECTECGEILESSEIAQLKCATPELTKVTNTASGVKFIWEEADGADSYSVYRKTYDAKAKKWGGWSKIAVGVTSTSYLDKSAKSGTYYRYTVRANNEIGLSGYITSGLKTYFLSTPKITSAANTNSGITIKWSKVSGANGYVVYRKTTEGWTKIATVKGNGTVSYTDKTAKAGITYRYTVRAYYGSYLSSYIAKGVAVRRLLTPVLKSVTSAKSGITLKWGQVTGATGYIVYRKTGNGSWQKLAVIESNSNASYLDKTAKKGTSYKYTVRAYYGTSKSYYNTKGLTIKDKY